MLVMPPAGVPQSIKLDTFLGMPIANGIDLPLAQDFEALARRGLRGLLLSPQVHQLTEPSTRYNCHGLVFGSRRTNIPPPGYDDEALIDWILIQDQYRRIPADQVHEGDVAVWRRANGIVEHTGYVAFRQDAPLTILIWSMWGGLGEFRHPVNLSPYTDCQVEYWRL